MKTPFTSIGVFCGARHGSLPIYETATREMAAILVRHGIEVVFGGGNVGLMGVLADEVLRLKGKITGVIPQFLLDWEVAHRGLTELKIVPTLAARKDLMFERSQAFLILPGGLGTLDELSEVLTWRQLKLHQKPCGILNTADFYAPLIAFFESLQSKDFTSKLVFDTLSIDQNQDKLLISLADSGSLLLRRQ